MKKDIHPKYDTATITCACGNVVQTKSTKKEMRIEICANCHPAFTGKKKFVDTAGRLERFENMIKSSDDIRKDSKKKKTRVKKQKAKLDVELIVKEQKEREAAREKEKKMKEAKKVAEEMKKVKIIKEGKVIKDVEKKSVKAKEKEIKPKVSKKKTAKKENNK